MFCVLVCSGFACLVCVRAGSLCDGANVGSSSDDDRDNEDSELGDGGVFSADVDGVCTSKTLWKFSRASLNVLLRNLPFSSRRCRRASVQQDLGSTKKQSKSLGFEFRSNHQMR
jgi:hypothetical protein